MNALPQRTHTRTLHPIRAFVILLGLAFGLAPLARAQEPYPRLQVFGGVSTATRGIEWEQGGTIMPGWQASVTGNFQRNFGATADFGGHYNAGRQFYQFLAGPSFRFASGELFAHALVGGANFRPGATPPTSGAAMAFGFGLDYGCSSESRACWRLGPLDYVVDHATGQWKHTVRIAAGIVFNSFPAR